MDVLGNILSTVLAAALTLILYIAGVCFCAAIAIFMLYLFAKSCDCCFSLLGGGDCAAIVIVFGIGVLFLYGLAANLTGASSL